MTSIDLPSQPPDPLKNCQATTLLFNVMVKCDFTSGSFQMIVHHKNEIRKLYVNQATSSSQTSASVVVDENGLYQVVVFAIRGDSGIVGSNVEHMELLIVKDVLPTTSNADTTTGMPHKQSLNYPSKTQSSCLIV